MSLLPPTPPMAPRPHFATDRIPPAPSFPFPNIMKPEIIDYSDHLCMNVHDFRNLEEFPLINQDHCFDTLDPFSSAEFTLYENHRISSAMHHLQGGGFFDFGDSRRDSFVGVESVFEHNSKPFSPNKTSCVTPDNLARRRSKKVVQSVSNRKCVRGQNKSKSAKGQWTLDEDRMLARLVERYGERKWSTISQMLKGRIGKQCRERWHNHLRPDIKKDVWTEEEDRVLIEIHAQVGNKWAEIAKSLPGRTENSIKNHWNATKRRQFSRRNCRSKWPKPSSLLQNYIKSLNLEKKSSSTSKAVAPKISGTLDRTVVGAPESVGIEYRSDNHIAPEYDFDDIITQFSFSDHDHLLLIDDMEHCDVDLSFDMPPPLMQCDAMKEIESFNA